jgi:hypothetical protein
MSGETKFKKLSLGFIIESEISKSCAENSL